MPIRCTTLFNQWINQLYRNKNIYIFDWFTGFSVTAEIFLFTGYKSYVVEDISVSNIEWFCMCFSPLKLFIHTVNALTPIWFVSLILQNRTVILLFAHLLTWLYTTHVCGFIVIVIIRTWWQSHGETFERNILFALNWSIWYIGIHEQIRSTSQRNVASKSI